MSFRLMIAFGLLLAGCASKTLVPGRQIASESATDDRQFAREPGPIEVRLKSGQVVRLEKEDVATIVTSLSRQTFFSFEEAEKPEADGSVVFIKPRAGGRPITDRFANMSHHSIAVATFCRMLGFREAIGVASVDASTLAAEGTTLEVSYIDQTDSGIPFIRPRTLEIERGFLGGGTATKPMVDSIRCI